MAQAEDWSSKTQTPKYHQHHLAKKMQKSKQKILSSLVPALNLGKVVIAL